MKKDTSVAITTFPTDGSLPPQHMTEGGSTKDRQEKCLALHRRQEAYKKFFADVSQISDGRSWDMFLRHSCPPLLSVSETKTHSTTTTRIDSKSKNHSGVPCVGYHGTACASETQASRIGRHISVENDDGSDEHAIVKNEDTSQDPKQAILSLTMTCSTLSTSCANLSAKAPVGPNVLVRKKHRPLHRSLPNKNGSIMGIIRPSRYSQGDAQLNSSMHSYLIKPSRYSRYDAQLNLSIHSYLIKPSGYSEEGDAKLNSSMHSYQSHSSTHSNVVNASWIPLGVNFHPSTEVYVFGKSCECEECLYCSRPDDDCVF